MIHRPGESSPELRDKAPDHAGTAQHVDLDVRGSDDRLRHRTRPPYARCDPAEADRISRRPRGEMLTSIGRAQTLMGAGNSPPELVRRQRVSPPHGLPEARITVRPEHARRR